jgi:hypothetical protein
VKTWWNWLKKCFTLWNFTKRSVFFFCETYPFWRWNWRQNMNLVKTWWNFQNLVNFRKLVTNSWNFRNLVKFSKPCEDLVKFRNLVKTWSNFQKPGECLGEVRAIFSTSGIFWNLVKTWWKPGEIPQPRWTWQ